MSDNYRRESRSISRVSACEVVDQYDKGQIQFFANQLHSAEPWKRMHQTAAPAWENVSGKLGGLVDSLRAQGERLAGAWSSEDSAAFQKALQHIAGTARHLSERAYDMYRYTDRAAEALVRAEQTFPDWDRDFLNVATLGQFGQGDPGTEDYRNWLAGVNADLYPVSNTIPSHVEVHLPQGGGDRHPWQAPPSAVTPPAPPGGGGGGVGPGIPGGGGGGIPSVPGAPGVGDGVPPEGISARSGWYHDDDYLGDGSGGGLAGVNPVVTPGGPAPAGLPAGGPAAMPGGPAGAPTAGPVVGPPGAPARGAPAAPTGGRPGGAVTPMAGGGAGANSRGGATPARGGGGAAAPGRPGGGMMPMAAAGGGAGAGGSGRGGGASGPGGAAAGRPGMAGGAAPMAGAGAGRGANDKEARPDSWLEEDDDPWTADEAPPSVIE